jgi:hypothetical protein
MELGNLKAMIVSMVYNLPLSMAISILTQQAYTKTKPKSRKHYLKLIFLGKKFISRVRLLQESKDTKMPNKPYMES